METEEIKKYGRELSAIGRNLNDLGARCALRYEDDEQTLEDICRVAEGVFEISFKAGKVEQARELYEEIICPMCYRLNPQHATADYGVGCKSCQEKEYYCGNLN